MFGLDEALLCLSLNMGIVKGLLCMLLKTLFIHPMLSAVLTNIVYCYQNHNVFAGDMKNNI